MENDNPQIIGEKSDKKYKDTFFRSLFCDKERALELFNAIEGTDFPKGTPLDFFSQGDKSLVWRNNDLAFVINNLLLAIKDHQGTLNPNMPFRLLPFAVDILYTWLTNKKELYKNKLVTIPTPKFYVLYNGKEKLKSNILRLSDSFRFDSHDFSMELTVKVIDINYKSGSEVLQKSPSLNGYAYLVESIRQNINDGLSRDIAIASAVNHCINKDILTKFLQENYQEVCSMFNYGITYEEEMEIKQEEAWEKGKIEGLIAAIKFLQKGISIEDVSNLLGLSESQIKELKIALHKC
jgi:hypothetical protein